MYNNKIKANISIPLLRIKEKEIDDVENIHLFLYSYQWNIMIIVVVE